MQKQKKTCVTTTQKQYLNQKITQDNIYDLATQTAKKALKTIYHGGKWKAKQENDNTITIKGGHGSVDETIHKMICGIMQDKHTLSKRVVKVIDYEYDRTKKEYFAVGDHDETHFTSENISDGQDIVNTAVAFYCQYYDKKLCDNANNGELTKTGEPIDIYRACLRHINRYIMTEKNRVFKTVYLQDLENGGEYIPVPKNWDMPTINDYKNVTATIDNMNLSATENKILSARLRGYGYDKIAKLFSISKGTVQTYLKRIQAKYTKLQA